MTPTASRCECGGKSTVTDTRARSFWLARRRKCLHCGMRWTTREQRVRSYRKAEANTLDKEVIAKLEKFVADLKARLWVS